MNPLAEYLLIESEREGTGPDAETQEQIDLLNSGPEDTPKKAVSKPVAKTINITKRAKPAQKSAKPRGKKKR
jgi:hypothetical protein